MNGDCSYPCEGATCRLSWPGEWQIDGLIGATFATLFWNGLVGFFIYELLKKPFDLGAVILLSVLALVGIALLALWLAVVTAPAWRLVWVFSPNGIYRRIGILGLGWVRRYEIPSDALEPALDRIELWRTEGDQRVFSLTNYTQLIEGNLRDTDYALFSLAFIRADGTKLLEIDSLTEGEARWMAGVILREYPSWFPASSRGEHDFTVFAVDS
jgi:hypothetical protein